MNRFRAAALFALLPAIALAQDTPTPTPTPGRRPTLSRVEATEQRDFTTTGGSSLADIVRRSQEQKEREGQTPKKSLGVITNENLKSGEAQPAGAKPLKSGTPTPRATPKAGIAPIPEFRDAKGRSESDWKGLINDAQARVTRANARIRQLDNETKKLENDFYAWSDGNYRDRVIKPAWDKALGDLKKTREEADVARQALSDLEDDARKSGAPPGWLR